MKTVQSVYTPSIPEYTGSRGNCFQETYGTCLSHCGDNARILRPSPFPHLKKKTLGTIFLVQKSINISCYNSNIAHFIKPYRDPVHM